MVEPVFAGCSPPSSSPSSDRRIARRISKEQHYEELCAALLLTAKEAGRDNVFELDIGTCEQRNTRAKQLWELCNSLMLSALVARISLQIKEGEVGAIGTAAAATPLGYCVAKWKNKPYKLQQEVKGMAGMLEAGTLVADAVLYSPVRFAPGWYTPSTVEAVVEVAQVLLTGLSLMTICDDVTLMSTGRDLKKARHPQAAKVPLCLHEAITEAALQRERLMYDESQSESESENGDDDLDGPELSDDEDERHRMA